MEHSNVRTKVRRRKVANLAAYSRQFTVRNNTKSISPKVEHKLIYDGDMSKAITNPFTGHKFIPTNPHQIPLDRGNATITAYEWVEPEGMLWKPERHKQPKPLIRHKARKYSNWKSYSSKNDTEGLEVKKIKCEKRNDFVKFFPNYPYTIKPITKEAYWEKFVEHKTAKWERKNPKPADMFIDDVEKWKQERENAKMRFRDFVVSIYDKLLLTGRFKTGESKFNEEEVAQIKDINGEGHIVNQLDPKKSKLIKKAQEITDETKAKKPNLVVTNLRDHKRTKGRIILPKAA